MASPGLQDPIPGTLGCGAVGKGPLGMGLPPWALRGPIRASWPRKAGEAFPGPRDLSWALWDAAPQGRGAGAGDSHPGPSGARSELFGPRKSGEATPGPWDPVPGIWGCVAQWKEAQDRGLPPRALRGLIRTSWHRKAEQAFPGPRDPAPGTLDAATREGAWCRGIPPGPQGTNQRFLAQEGWGSIPSADEPLFRALSDATPWRRGPGAVDSHPEPIRDRSELLGTGRWGGLPRATGPQPGHFGRRRPGEGGPWQGTPTPGPEGARSELLGPGRPVRPSQGCETPSWAL